MSAAIKTSWSWTLKTEPARLWPAISHTERLNKVIGLPEPEFVDTPHEGGGTVRAGRVMRLGLEERWQEHPYEWVEPRRFQVTRDYDTGLLSRMLMRVLLEPAAGGGSEVTFELELTPAHFVGHAAALVELRRLEWAVGKAYRRVDAAMQTAESMAALAIQHDPYERLEDRLDDPQRLRLQHLLRKAKATGDAPAGALQLIADLIGLAPDHVVERMRPRQLARRWQIDPDDALDAFLVAAKVGLVNLDWSVLCPNCRAESKDVDTLSELEAETHCGACNIDFATEFTESVELTFRPSGSVRPVSVGTYCIGGPGSAPHTPMQQWLQPGETRELEVSLTAGNWRIFGPRVRGQHYLDTGAQAQASALQITVTADGQMQVQGQPSPGQVSVTVLNHSPWDQVVRIDRVAWRDDAVTAAQVTSRSNFRRWFSTEVLSPGTHVEVGQMAVLFTDLQASTQMYEALGDAAAYAKVREHFAVLRRAAAQSGGTLVKTIGDAIMVVWADPLTAVQTALRFQQALDAAPATRGLVIKVGLHHGSCIGVNLNDAMDYFGTTVNHAARLERVAGGGEVALSSDLASEPAVASWLAAQPFASRREVEVELKGLRGTYCVLVLAPQRDVDGLE